MFPCFTGISNTEARQPGKAPNFSVNWMVGDQGLEVINATTGKDDLGRPSRLCKHALYSRWVRLHCKVMSCWHSTELLQTALVDIWLQTMLWLRKFSLSCKSVSVKILTLYHYIKDPSLSPICPIALLQPAHQNSEAQQLPWGQAGSAGLPLCQANPVQSLPQSWTGCVGEETDRTGPVSSPELVLMNQVVKVLPLLSDIV